MRLEAATASSYLATPAAFNALVATLSHPRETHLAYAIRTALGAESMLPFWNENPPPTVAAFLQTFDRSARIKAGAAPRNAREADFDAQKNVAVVRISCVTGRLLYTKDQFEVKAGQPVKLIFSNPDATKHNLIILDHDTPLEEIGTAANDMARSPDGEKKHFIPTDKRILHASKLLPPNSSETLRFIAPKEPGRYPFLCTYPGHWTIMKGEMIVK